ncbi:unnamed protein product [Ceratitis capitata]|uniref:(Mediterranean fruit fly) hypothetical protein n=1 Tax=Ceratitis capitata TaxID=7213 RepID=A0A811VB63_CERCA|nr:unnamed protein product [Ceratitis capitata]
MLAKECVMVKKLGVENIRFGTSYRSKVTVTFRSVSVSSCYVWGFTLLTANQPGHGSSKTLASKGPDEKMTNKVFTSSINLNPVSRADNQTVKHRHQGFYLRGGHIRKTN